MKRRSRLIILTLLASFPVIAQDNRAARLEIRGPQPLQKT
jgi:hypothetical protein